MTLPSRARDERGRYAPEQVGAEGEKIIRNLGEYRYWHDHRDHLIAEALCAGIPVYRISMESGVHTSLIYKIRKRLAAFAES